MRILTLSSALGAALLATLNVQAADAPYYNPANPASASGKTTGYELYKTIGCPGRGILEAPCAAPVDAKAAPVVKAAEKALAKPLDSDGDGVSDDRDRCPETVRGARVDANGCELDSDGDGVVDRLDQCPTTPAGRKVDAQGCEPDGDGDGVVDALDQCPNTPAGTPVDDKGCTLPKTLRLEGVNFDNDADTLRPDGIAILEGAAATLKRYPGFKVEVAGHTDSRGSHTDNLDLSRRRAQTVMDYFITHGIAAGRLSAKGYGETRPIGNNTLEEGRMKNRRVELRVLD